MSSNLLNCDSCRALPGHVPRQLTCKDKWTKEHAAKTSRQKSMLQRQKDKCGIILITDTTQVVKRASSFPKENILLPLAPSATAGLPLHSTVFLLVIGEIENSIAYFSKSWSDISCGIKSLCCKSSGKGSETCTVSCSTRSCTRKTSTNGSPVVVD